MANQGIDRRRALEMLAKAAVAAQFGGFERWAFAGTPAPQGGTKTPYEPRYFTAPEYQVLDLLTELIIPADESPGAHDAGVAEFIDFLAAHGETEIQQPMRDGLAEVNRIAKEQHGGDFEHLPAGVQAAILERLESTPFFPLIRRYTTIGYYTSRVGLKELDYPGLRMYTQSPGCPHRDDPEHKHLQLKAM